MSHPSSAKAPKAIGFGFGIALATFLAFSLAPAAADPAAPSSNAPNIDGYVAEMWSGADAEWQQRLKQDETQAVCSQFRNSPPDEAAKNIRTREAATIKYPADGKLLGNWQEGEKIAQNGRGGQFSDAPDAARGGNCYACHQLSKTEVAFGTLGPSLTEYGKVRDYAADAAKETYAKIYNSQATTACSSMPRFGVHGFLTEQQIKDVLAYLFDPDSPVNK